MWPVRFQIYLSLDPLFLVFLYCTPMVLRRRSVTSLSSLISWFVLFTIALGGCQTKTIRYPQDHERLKRIDQVVESLRTAYQGENRLGFQSLLMLPSDQLEEVQRQAEADFEAFQTIALEFTVERVLIEGENVDVLVHWQGAWKKDADDPGIRQRGHARLQWVGTQTILLRAVQGDLPFGMKAKQMFTDIAPPQKPQSR